MRFLFFFLGIHCLILGAPLKVLHLTFHQGCAQEFEGLAKALGWNLTTWKIFTLPPQFFDGESSGAYLLNIGHDRAKRIWELHHDFFETFDLIITSDTAPLSRIFLQNKSRTPLIIWISNRFDYADTSHLDCDFPDNEYYNLIKQASFLPHVKVVASAEFEQVYARMKGVYTGHLIINPAGFTIEENLDPSWSRTHFYLPHYYNDEHLLTHIRGQEIPFVFEYHKGLLDLKEYKGIIHFPYTFSSIALFEHMQIGIPYFIPSISFLKELCRRKGYWHQNKHFLFTYNLYPLSEWYRKEHKELFIYFDSWEDLKRKIENCDYIEQRKKILAFAKQHREMMLRRWQEVIDSLIPHH